MQMSVKSSFKFLKYEFRKIDLIAADPGSLHQTGDKMLLNIINKSNFK